MEDTEKRPQRRPGGRSARVRESVLAASLDLITTKGLSGCTVAEIAKKSGVHETTIYRKWGSVERLLLDSLIDTIGGEMPIPDTGSLRTDLMASLESGIAFYRTSLGKTLVRALGAVGEEGNDLRREYWDRRIKAIEPMIERARTRGELAPDLDVKFLFELAVGPIFMRLFVTGEELEPNLAAKLVDVVLGRPR
jgi:AcrR family transcriptional regulator